MLIAIFLCAANAYAGHLEPPTSRDRVTHSGNWYYHRSSDGTLWRSHQRNRGWTVVREVHGRKIRQRTPRHPRHKRARRHPRHR